VTSLRCCIPECEFNVDRLIELLVEDRNNNPSRYAMVLLSEGATWTGRKTEEFGEPDAYGHRKKVNVADAFATVLKRKAEVETVVADLTYELRSGEPDFLDKMVSTSFATMACECIFDNASGRMTAVRNGSFTDTEIPDPALGPRSVDVENLWNLGSKMSYKWDSIKKEQEEGWLQFQKLRWSQAPAVAWGGRRRSRCRAKVTRWCWWDAGLRL
jgi:6-phosphofructokinase 1